MPSIAFPDRKTDDARRADEEFAAVIEQMTSSGEPITARAVIRRMRTLSQPSSITRDVWRMEQITTAERERILKLVEGAEILDEEPNKKAATSKIVPDIRYLLSFTCLARMGNFGSAARELNMGQPTLSRQIQALEETFSARLFVRHGRGVILTPAGSRLARRLEVALPLLTARLDRERDEEQDMDVRSASAVSSLSLGVIPGIGGSVVPQIVRQFRARWPDIKLILNEGSSSILEELLMGQELDCAVLQDPPGLDILHTEPVWADTFGLIASVGTRVGEDRSPIRLRDLVGLPLVLPRVASDIRRRLEKVCHQHGVRLCPLLETESLQLTQAIVRSGQAFTVLPSLSAQDELGQGRLIFRDIMQPTITTIHAVATNRGAGSPQSRELMALVRSAMISSFRAGAVRARLMGPGVLDR